MACSVWGRSAACALPGPHSARCKKVASLCKPIPSSRASLSTRQVLSSPQKLSLVKLSHNAPRLKQGVLVKAAAIAMSSAAGAAPDGSSATLRVEFNNIDDPEATIVTVSGPDQPDLLMQLTGAFNTLDLSILSAIIKTSEDGSVYDTFRLVDANDQKIPEDQWDQLASQLIALCSTSNRSSKPAIYGAVSATEVERLRPLSTETAGDAQALELAAAEMASAAAALVAIEREILDYSTTDDVAGLVAKEMQRTEAAATLERRMAAMEAVLAARRTPVQPAAPSSARGPGADLRFQMGGGTSSGPAAGNGYEIILQGFNWESHRQKWYQVLKSQAGQIADAGFTAVWLPPPSDSVSAQGYLPRDLYCLDSCYGSEADLRDLLAVLHENGLKAIADIVINHRCAHAQSEDGKWNKFGGRLAWDKSAICHNNPAFGGTGAAKIGEDYVAAPNIDHTNQKVREDLKQWLKYLRTSIGFDGWRFDFVKGYHGKYAREYIDHTVPLMAFGEFWDTCEYTDGVLNYNQDAHRQRTVDWCDATGGTAAAFDFTTKGILQEAMGRGEYWRLVDSQGRPPGLMGLWPSRAITFIENHDTGSTLNHWPFPWSHLHEGYAYILTHPGTPCIFYDHFWTEGLGQSIRNLTNIRKRQGLSNRSKVTVQKASTDTYAATVDNKIAMKVGWGSWSPDAERIDVGQKSWSLATSGPNFAVWNAVF